MKYEAQIWNLEVICDADFDSVVLKVSSNDKIIEFDDVIILKTMKT